MPQPPFVSHAQNGEDVVLRRALADIETGRYVEIGANDPLEDSVTWAFYERGWSGITVDPVHAFVEAHREARPRDTQVEAAVTNAPVESITLHQIAGTGLSTLVDSVGARHEASGFELTDVTVAARSLDSILEQSGWEDEDIHFLLVDVEGAEADVLASVDLTRWRPWILVVESTEPRSTNPSHGEWEPGVLAAGYEFCLFDGLSRFYVAKEHAERLRQDLSYPACILDNFVPARFVAELAGVSAELERVSDQLERTDQLLHGTTAELERQILHWKRLALVEWARPQVVERVAEPDPGAEHARRELEAMRHTVSWRVTKPLRGVRRLMGRSR